ncbi:NPM3 protein, partial [Piaya cayana]|nr:NPM3 protein [Piaya cayana]
SDLFAGCELTASTKSYTFQVDEEDDADHILALSVVRGMKMNRACPFLYWLTPSFPASQAHSQNHRIVWVGRDIKNIRSTSVSVQLSLDNFKLQPPVTFRLAAGSGPVHLAGWHQIVHREDVSFEEDDDLSEEDELPPIMPAKK